MVGGGVPMQVGKAGLPPWGLYGGHAGATGTVVVPWGAQQGSAVQDSSWSHLQGTGIVQPGPLGSLRAGCGGMH